MESVMIGHLAHDHIRRGGGSYQYWPTSRVTVTVSKLKTNATINVSWGGESMGEGNGVRNGVGNGRYVVAHGCAFSPKLAHLETR